MFEERSVKNTERQIMYDGIPFIVLGTKVLDCTHGTDRMKLKKEKRAQKALVCAI